MFKAIVVYNEFQPFISHRAHKIAWKHARIHEPEPIGSLLNSRTNLDQNQKFMTNQRQNSSRSIIVVLTNLSQLVKNFQQIMPGREKSQVTPKSLGLILIARLPK